MDVLRKISELRLKENKLLSYKGHWFEFALLIEKICHIFTLTVDIQSLLSKFEDVQQQIFLPAFHQVPILAGS